MARTFSADPYCQFMSVAIFTVCGVTACGGGSSDSDPTLPAPPVLSFDQSSDAALTTNGSVSAEQYVKNGLFLMEQRAVEAGLSQGGLDDGTSASPSEPHSEAYSQTNTQEAGVDEADRIEYDGNYMYVASAPYWTSEGQVFGRVRVIRRQEDFSLVQVANLPLAEDFNAHGMYLHDDTLSVISRTYNVYPLAAEPSIAGPWHQTDNVIDIQLYDVSTPEQTSESASIRIDGGLIDSRRIGGDLYVVSQFTPRVVAANASTLSEQQLYGEYTRISALDSEELVPTITINDTTLPLYSLQQCWLPADAAQDEGNPHMLSVTKINLTNPTQFSATCMMASVHTVYMSAQSLYLAAGYEGDTVLHKVRLEEQPQYAATGKVAGEIYGRANARFRLGEAADRLRIVTTDYSDFNNPIHQLHILAQEGNELVTVGKLPNEARPQALGKPGEDIYAVRYRGDTAYVVTFEQIDPLYVLDLSVAEDPVITGSLEIPGFSSYLHPMENGLLLGVGQQVNSNLLPNTGDEVAITPVEDGLKVSLFDVQDPANPLVLSQFSWPDSYTPVEYDPRALAVVKLDTGYRFAMPTENWNFNAVLDSSGAQIQTSPAVVLPYNITHALEVSFADRSLSVIDSVVMPVSGQDYYLWSGEDRTIIHGDHMYHLRGNQLWHSLWMPDSAVAGPY